MNCSKFRLLLIVLALASGPDASWASGEIRSVALDEASFNPSIGEELRISYELPGDDRVTLQVFDLDGGLVRTLVEVSRGKPDGYRRSGTVATWMARWFRTRPTSSPSRPHPAWSTTPPPSPAASSETCRAPPPTKYSTEGASADVF